MQCASRLVVQVFRKLEEPSTLHFRKLELVRHGPHAYRHYRYFPGADLAVPWTDFGSRVEGLRGLGFGSLGFGGLGVWGLRSTVQGMHIGYTALG